MAGRAPQRERRRGAFRRRFLVQDCYLNPGAFARFRRPWAQAGFRVVDCPSLTEQTKSNADLVLALDVLDALREPQYDEFLLLSADSDFTPLVRRLRAKDRRVTVVLAGHAVSAYRALADEVVEPAEFSRLVRGLPRHPVTPAASTFLVATAAPAAATAVTRVTPVAPTPPAIVGRPAAATKGLNASPTSAASGAGAAATPAAASMAGAAANVPASAASAKAVAVRKPSNSPVQPDRPTPATATPTVDDVQARRAVVKLLTNSHGTVAGSSVGQCALAACPQLRTTKWCGYGNLSTWLAERVPIADQSNDGTHLVWDSRRYGVRKQAVSWTVDQVAGAAEAPALSDEQYATLFTALAADINAEPFLLPLTTKRVRDACVAAGAPIGRSHVNTVLRRLATVDGLLVPSAAPEGLALAWADAVVSRCRESGLDLGTPTEAAVRQWASGGLLRAA